MKLARAILATAVAGSLLAFDYAASADPDAVLAAKQRLEAIQEQQSAIEQEAIDAGMKAEAAKRDLARAHEDLKAQQGKVSTLSDELGAVAVMEMQHNGMDSTMKLLMSATDDSFLDSLAVLHSETERSNARLQQLQNDQARLTSLQKQADVAKSEMEKNFAALEARSKDFENKSKEAQAVYDQLEAEEQERLRRLQEEEERRRAEAAAAAEAEARQAEQLSRSQARAALNETSSAAASPSTTAAASPSATSSASASASASASQSSSRAAREQSATPSATRLARPSATPTPTKTKKVEEKTEAPVAAPSSSRAKTVINAALAQVGKGYRLGTMGPSTFDCSGLTSYAYRQVGITLPRTSRAQYTGAGRAVSVSNIQPGDLVFYYSGPSHVAIYIGNGRIVHAANPRSGVTTTGLHSMPIKGVRRVL